MRKTDDHVILKLLNEGNSQKDIAQHFNVSGAAICKRVKKILSKKPKSLERLTEKEQKFVLAISEGKTQTQAALNSHECSSLDSAKSMGWQLMQKGDIQTAVAELMQEEGLTRRYRVQKLKSHIDHPDPNVSLKGLDQSWKLDGAYVEKHVHVHASYEDMKREQAECHDRIANSDRKFKNFYLAEIKKIHPEMNDETVSEMAEKTLDALFPERENLDFLGETIEGEIIEKN
jgi:hypothetical protein